MKETLVFHYTNVEMSEDEIHLLFFLKSEVYTASFQMKVGLGGRGCVFNNC
jgi:hypothetical protein